MGKEIVLVVKGLVFNSGRMLIIKRSETDDIDPGGWEMGGGKIEFGESPEEALVREIKEEAGLDVQVGRLLYASTFKTNPSRQVVVLCYKCKAFRDMVSLSDEHSDFMWASKPQIRKFFMPSIIEDFKKNGVFDIEEFNDLTFQ